MMHKDMQSLAPGALVQLLEVDLLQARIQPAAGTTVFRCSTSAKPNKEAITWGGVTYGMVNFAFSNINLATGSAMMEPMLNMQVAKNSALMQFLLDPDADIRMAKVTRTLIYEKYLDHGFAPSTDPSNYKQQVFYVIQLDDLTGTQVDLKLSAACGIDSLADKTNRTLSVNQCAKKYRVFNITDQTFKYTPVADGGCEWGQDGEAGNFPYCGSFGTPYFTSQDEATADPAQDRCSLSVAGCKKRFPVTQSDQPFPYFGNLTGLAGT